jgi:hypothetical protein
MVNMQAMRMNGKMSKIILISDIVETKLRKEKELQYYQEELEKLKQKMFFLQKDIDITNLIINMIENEKVLDVKEQMQSKLLGDDSEL